MQRPYILHKLISLVLGRGFGIWNRSVGAAAGGLQPCEPNSAVMRASASHFEGQGA